MSVLNAAQIALERAEERAGAAKAERRAKIGTFRGVGGLCHLIGAAGIVVAIITAM